MRLNKKAKELYLRTVIIAVCTPSQNYKENKEKIDANVKQAVIEWNKPNPTNAGKLAGEVMALINGKIDETSFLQ